MALITVVVIAIEDTCSPIETIRSLADGRSALFPLEVIVVRSPLTTNTPSLVTISDRARNLQLRELELERSTGAAEARNRAAELAIAPTLLFTDACSRFAAGWDIDLLREADANRIATGAMRQNGNTTATCHTLALPSMFLDPVPAPSDSVAHDVPIANAACMAIKRELFSQLGRFDPAFETDVAITEFSIRAWLAGYRICALPEMAIRHQIGQGSDRLKKRPPNDPRVIREHLMLAAYYLPEDLQRQSLSFYEAVSPKQSTIGVADLDQGRLLARREQLKNDLVHDFRWFQQRFLKAADISVEGTKQVPSCSKLSVVVLTHDAYFRWLPEVMASVHRQRAAIREIILVVDWAGAPIPSFEGAADAKVVRRKFPSPNHARNAGLDHVRTDWVCYVDGDNTPDPGYFARMRSLTDEAPSDVAILYPDLNRVDTKCHVQHIAMPDWDYWTCRERSIIDTCSAWRTKALRQAGGWFLPAECLQDYVTALKITEQGWKARKATGMIATLRDHPGSVSKRVHAIPEALWHARRYAVVSLFAGRRHCLAPLMAWYVNEAFPPNTHVIWVDDSRNKEFHTALWRHAEEIRHRVASVQVWKYDRLVTDVSSFHSLHDHIGAMYNLVFGSVTADVYLTVEDDVIAPLGSVRQILNSEVHVPYSRWGGVCAVYPSRFSKDKRYMVASLDKDRWTKCPVILGFPPRIVEMGMIGAGFSAWNGAILQRVLPVHSSTTSCGDEFGWDGTLSRKITNSGYRIAIDGRIRCQHLVR